MGGWIVPRPERPKPYLARFQPRGGRTVSKSFRTKREANAWLKVQEVDRSRGDWIDPRSGNVTIAEWSVTWLEGRRVRPSTRARDESYLRSLVLPWLGERPLNQLTPSEIREWIVHLESLEKAPATIRKAYQILGNMLNQAVDDARIVKTPLPRRPGLPAPTKREMTILSPEQAHELANASDPRYRALILTAAYTGLRFGELTALRTESIDFLRRSLTVTETLTDVRGEIRLGPPKTKRSARTVAISSSLVDALGRHLELRGNDVGWVFAAPGGGPIRRTNFRRRVWLPAVESSGFGKLLFHDLRHTHAAWLISQGEHPKVISERLGHSSISVTLDVYGHLMPGMDEQAADRLDQLWVRESLDVSRTIRAPGDVTHLERPSQNVG